MPDTEVLFRPYTPGDEGAIEEMRSEAFDDAPGLDRWRWRFFQHPTASSIVIVAEIGGEIVGHLGAVALETYASGTRILTSTASDHMVRPGRRGRKVGTGLAAAYLRHAEANGWIPISFANRQMERMLTEDLGVQRVGHLRRWVRVLGPARPIGRVLRPRVQIHGLDSFGPETDELAAASATHAPCIRVRDAAYMCWRWLRVPGGAWEFSVARDAHGSPCGLVVYGRDRKQPKIGRVVDAVACDERVLRALLGTACDALGVRGCRAVTFYYSDPRSWAMRACLRSGFVPTRGRIVYSLPNRGLCDWYLTHGDIDVV